ncbi:prolyl oligopeptidase family serine peptidase [Oceanobacter kriegii]|uniref:prolyl oligopeptidase family serine peptidase n=1 Tax=Oceanobacter kriegii TaxID=64972 RepID=UPI0003FCEBE0|nr:prolyl oligopeptidase family serine peptidase [Oceanobacter kriegii]
MTDIRQIAECAERAVQQGKQWAELRTAGQWIGWLEFDPALAKNRLCLASVKDINDFHYPLADISARSRVHEYGGGSWCLWENGLAYVNEADQGIYWLALDDASAKSEQVWQRTDYRYADLTFDPVNQRLLAVEEDHTAQALASNPSGVREPVNRLVAIAIELSSASQRTVLAEGADFYAGPVAGPLINNQQQLSWISWNHPHQPWLSTTVSLAQVNAQGGADVIWQFNADEQAISCVQPGFDASGNLLFVSDHTGYWNLYRYLYRTSSPAPLSVEELANELVALYPSTSEFAAAPWQLGGRHWASLDATGSLGNGCLGSRWLATGLNPKSGQSELFVGAQSGVTRLPLPQPAARLHGITFNHDTQMGYAIQECQDRSAAIVSWSLNDAEAAGTSVGSASGSDEQNDDPKVAVCSTIAPWPKPDADEQPAAPEALQIPCGQSASEAQGSQTGGSRQIQHLQAWLYKAHSQPQSQTGSQPLSEYSDHSVNGLIIQLHGGPTAFADSSFDAQRQFWCEQGYHVLVLNYRGSSNLGKAYRSALQGSWGISDVEDVFVACDYVIQQGLAKAGQLFVRGGSAGGYTVLQVLSHPDAQAHGIAGGASHYGISDLLLLDQFTHKFESQYLNWLIGDAEQDRQRYLDRSAIHNLDTFQLPVIFFQGAIDKVVPPEQTRAIYDALQQRGIRSEYVLFEGEGHGFRKAEHRIDVLIKELAFYQAS